MIHNLQAISKFRGFIFSFKLLKGLSEEMPLQILRSLAAAFKGSHFVGQPPAHCHGRFMFHPKISCDMFDVLSPLNINSRKAH